MEIEKTESGQVENGFTALNVFIDFFIGLGHTHYRLVQGVLIWYVVDYCGPVVSWWMHLIGFLFVEFFFFVLYFIFLVFNQKLVVRISRRGIFGTACNIPFCFLFLAKKETEISTFL